MRKNFPVDKFAGRNIIQIVRRTGVSNIFFCTYVSLEITLVKEILFVLLFIDKNCNHDKMVKQFYIYKVTLLKASNVFILLIQNSLCTHGFMYSF